MRLASFVVLVFFGDATRLNAGFPESFGPTRASRRILFAVPATVYGWRLERVHPGTVEHVARQSPAFLTWPAAG